MWKSFVKPVGIVAYAGYIPHLKVATDLVIGKNKSDKSFYKAVTGYDEDTGTFALNIADTIIDSFPHIDTSQIGALYCGSESFPYAVKPLCGLVGELFGAKQIAGADMQFACKAGTASLQTACAYVASGIVPMAAGFGMDISQARIGDELERNVGAGGAGFVVGENKQDFIAEIVYTTSYATDTPDFWRRPKEEYPEHTGKFTAEPGYITHISAVIEQIFSTTGMKSFDFDFVVFHSPIVKLPDTIAKKYGFHEEALVHRILFPQIGNAYAGSSMLGLCYSLEHAKPEQNILAVSYGSGSGSDGFVLRTTKNITKYRPKITIDEMLQERREIWYEEYVKTVYL